MNKTISPELYHYGIKGMKWGVRRYQNSDGSLTPAGQKRMKRQATSILKAWEIPETERATRRYDKTWNGYETKTNKATDKANEAIRNNNIKKFARKYEDSIAYGNLMVKYGKAATESEKYSKWLKNKLNDISNDTLVAGRDYVANMKTGWGTIDYSIDFLSGKEPYGNIKGRRVMR